MSDRITILVASHREPGAPPVNKALAILEMLAETACDLASEGRKVPGCTWAGFSSMTLPEENGMGTLEDLNAYLVAHQASLVQRTIALSQVSAVAEKGYTPLVVCHVLPDLQAAKDRLN